VYSSSQRIKWEAVKGRHWFKGLKSADAELEKDEEAN
jgi:hypothetical protein